MFDSGGVFSSSAAVVHTCSSRSFFTRSKLASGDYCNLARAEIPGLSTPRALISF